MTQIKGPHCTCFDCMGALDDDEHFATCPWADLSRPYGPFTFREVATIEEARENKRKSKVST
jgi:hypothetical protein